MNKYLLKNLMSPIAAIITVILTVTSNCSTVTNYPRVDTLLTGDLIREGDGSRGGDCWVRVELHGGSGNSGSVPLGSGPRTRACRSQDDTSPRQGY